MLKISHYLVFSFLFSFHLAFSQSVEIVGQIETKINIENIHVINKTSQLFTITNAKGEFKIYVTLNDTLQFSSIQHKLKEVIVTQEIVSTKICLVVLDKLINELDEVLVGRVLTGDLLSDINNVEGDPPINFFDVGIPGYKGKKATQSKRRLYQAGEFKPIMLLGLLAGGMPLDPILNGISGRTKELKLRVKLEANTNLLRKVRASLPKDFFITNKLDKYLRADFFYFCEESENFNERCNGKTDVEILEFVKEKFTEYESNLNSNKD